MGGCADAGPINEVRQQQLAALSLPNVGMASAIDIADATLFGAGSKNSTEIVRYLRWGKGTFANVRPARWVPGCNSPLINPENIDLIILRENLEDLALGIGGNLDELYPLGLSSGRANSTLEELGQEFGGGKYAIKVITEGGSERIVRYAFELARERKAAGKRGKVTCGTKHNLIPQPDGLFLEVSNRVAPDYPDIEYENWIIDDFARRLIAEPQEFDVVVLPSLYGDIFSDAAGGLIGGLGLCPSGCYAKTTLISSQYMAPRPTLWAKILSTLRRQSALPG